MQAAAENCAAEIPIGRVYRADEIGDSVMFFGSNVSSVINGVKLIIDGGQTQAYTGHF